MRRLLSLIVVGVGAGLLLTACASNKENSTAAGAAAGQATPAAATGQKVKVQAGTQSVKQLPSAQVQQAQQTQLVSAVTGAGMALRELQKSLAANPKGVMKLAGNAQQVFVLAHDPLEASVIGGQAQASTGPSAALKTLAAEVLADRQSGVKQAGLQSVGGLTGGVLWASAGAATGSTSETLASSALFQAVAALTNAAAKGSATLESFGLPSSSVVQGPAGSGKQGTAESSAFAGLQGAAAASIRGSAAQTPQSSKTAGIQTIAPGSSLRATFQSVTGEQGTRSVSESSAFAGLKRK